MSIINKQSNNYLYTLILLCIGYFIDFYDLTIFASSYTKLIPDLFNITNPLNIQITYLNISNFYVAGILFGSLTFGFLGDKFGRSAVIKYSILIYSLATLFSIFASSIYIFTILRFISGFGLATEFATSSVLIAELFSNKLTAKYTSFLYISGVLGGICATFLAIVSWKILFIFGGTFGLIIFGIRKYLIESPIFIKAHTSTNINFYRNILTLVFPFNNFITLLKLFLLILPYNLLISIMFIFPNFMHLNGNLSQHIHNLLLYFFIGNIISTFASSYIVNYYKKYSAYLLINISLFIAAMLVFPLISNSLFTFYALILGILGGGLPVVWIQIITKSYNTSIRNTASNALFALGRVSTILFHLIIVAVLQNHINFYYFSSIIVILVSIFSWFSIMFIKETYNIQLK
ncbi:MFS transporter [Rickettsiales bacterium LUAb2]